jgi:hypothetical protein
MDGFPHGIVVVHDTFRSDSKQLMEPVAYLYAQRVGHPAMVLPGLAYLWTGSPLDKSATRVVGNLLSPTPGPYRGPWGWDLISEPDYRRTLGKAEAAVRVERVLMTDQEPLPGLWAYTITPYSWTEPCTVTCTPAVGGEMVVCSSLTELWQHVHHSAQERANWMRDRDPGEAAMMDALAETAAGEATLAALES